MPAANVLHLVEKKFIIKNLLGMHARAAAAFVKTANRFQADVFISKGRQTVNGKSIMGVLMLAAAKGSQILIRTEGEDAEEAMHALTELVENKFGEE